MNDVRKSIQDAAYTAVGVGVLGAQVAVAKGQQAKDALGDRAGDVRTTAETKATAARTEVKATATKVATDTRSRVEAIVFDVRERVEPVVAKISERVEPLFADVRERIEPVVGQLQSKAIEISEVGTAKARTFLGRPSTLWTNDEPAGDKASKDKATTKIA